MFNVMDFVVVKKEYEGRYLITKSNVLCVVMKVGDRTVNVAPVAVNVENMNERVLDTYFREFSAVNGYFSSGCIDGFEIGIDHLEVVSKDDFFKEGVFKQADASIMEMIEASAKVRDMLSTAVECSVVNPYTEEEVEDMYEHIKPFFVRYGYSVDESVVKTIIEKSLTKKAPLISILSKHPNWNPKKKMIVQKGILKSGINQEILDGFLYWMKSNIPTLLKQHEITVENISYSKLRSLLNGLRNEDCLWGSFQEGHENEWLKEGSRDIMTRISAMKAKLRKLKGHLESEGEICDACYETIAVERKFYQLSGCVKKVVGYIEANKDKVETMTSQQMAEGLNSLLPELKVSKGQKFSRVLNKICSLIGLNEMSDYEREFSKVGDALNPIEKERWIIVSVNPVDFWLMSRGANWTSCHTIDKTKVDRQNNGDDDNYHGCNSSGTESYMRDTTSFIMYVVSEKYNGDEFEIQPKILRQMYHWKDGLLIGSRIYPKANTDNDTLYQSAYDFMQTTISNCGNENGRWINFSESNRRVILRNIETTGTHYPDYTQFASVVKTSYICKEKIEMEDKAMRKMIVPMMPKMVIGSKPICPYCGTTHTSEGNILCRNCIDAGYYEFE